MPTSIPASQQVALVTGGNRGLGLETAKQLAKRGMAVVLGSRDEAKGKEAAERLAADGLRVTAAHIDVADEASIAALAKQLDGTHGRLDVLVNNAGAVFDPKGESSILTAEAETLERTFRVNTVGAVLCCKHLVPLMKKHGFGRVVNVSSGMGQLSDMNSGWPGYRLSKTALNAVTRILSEELKGSGIKVNSVCPGWVRTDMGGPNATRSIEEGVDTIVWLATLHDDGPSGGFFRDCKQIPW
jgi:NAD(P)-dependent dehydrogenase (short-subunit alcohol dehydrogenase family)